MGTVCVVTTNSCGQSLPYCQTFEITPIPLADFDVDPIICVDSTASAFFTLASQPGYVYNWSLSGGSIISSPNSNGIDTLEINWSDPGLKYINLQLENNGCQSVIKKDSVQVIDNQNPPAIGCNPEANQIEFYWTPLPGQTASIVNVLSGQSGMQIGNTYLVTGLVPGVEVQIEITNITNHPCGNLLSSGSCITQNCIPENISINPWQPICLTSNYPLINLKDSVVSGTQNGTYKFTGTGVVDDVNGIFDAKVAGIGKHQIRLIYTDATGCISAAAFTEIEINGIPTSTFIADNIICQDSLATINYNGNIVSGGSFIWSLGKDSIPPSSYQYPFKVGWSTPGNKILSLVTEKNGCTSNLTTINVKVEPRIVPVVISCPIIGATVMTFDWNDVPNTSGYSVTLNGQSQPNSAQSMLSLNNLSVLKDYTIIVKANSNNACPGVADTLICKTLDCPLVTIKFSIPDSTICFGPNLPNIDINATISGGLQSANQTLTWSGGTYINASTGVFNPNLAGIGTHNIKLSLVDGTCLKDTSMKITIIAKPVSTFTGKTNICITDNYEVTYTGTSNLPLKWKLPSGVTSTPVNGQPAKFKITFPKDGVYDLKLVSGNANCVSDTTKLTVKVDPELMAVAINCKQTTTSVDFDWNNIIDNCVTGYKVFINNVAKGTQTNLNYNLNNLMTGEKVEIRIEPVTICACPSIPSVKVCEAKLCPAITTKLSSPFTAFCEGSKTTAFQLISTETGTNGTGTGVWSGSNVNATGLFNPLNIVPGVYKSFYTFSEDNCDYKDSILIEVFDLPEVSTETIQPDCYLENTGQANVSTLNGKPAYSYTLNGLAKTLPLIDLTPAAYELVVTDVNNCTDANSFTIKSADVPTLVLSGNTNITSGLLTELTATTTGLE
ncbi:MAG: hypothetical protein IPO92_06750 [Saprospiraceae bacterium]|nr:hypothetical protein [Saprospiraceae bacterium]